MQGSNPLVNQFAAWVHRRFLLLLLAAYSVAAVGPEPGLVLRKFVITRFATLDQQVSLTVPTLLLGFLLFNAGLGVRRGQIGGIARRPGLLLAALVANTIVPLAFIFAVAVPLLLWHNSSEVQCVVLGLAVITAMPVAGSSAAWAQHAGGDLGLSLGLILASTLLSPLTTPLALRAVAPLTAAEFAPALKALASSGTGVILGLCVVAPALLGIAVGWACGEARLAGLRPALRLATSMCLLVLIYANAAVSLPAAVACPDWDFLGLIVVAVAGMCGTAFAAGGLLGWLWRAEPGQRSALIFGLGMANNGTGLVLAGLALAEHPRVLLPVIVCNLLQHLLAAAVHGLPALGLGFRRTQTD